MAFSKATAFDPLLYHQSFWCSALGHPARIVFLTHLLHYGTTPFYELAQLVPLAKTTSSQHLRNLRDNGLIEAKEIYPHTFYSIKRSICLELAQKLSGLNSMFLDLS